MRRRAAAVVGRASAALLALVAPVAVLPGTASAATSVVISPAHRGDTAVRDTAQIAVSGTTGGNRILSATFFGREADGDVVFQDVAEGALNRIATPPNDFLRVDAGQISGRLTLPCIYAEPFGSGPFDPNTPCATHEAVRHAWLQVEVAGEVGRSNELRVDYTRPVVRQYETATTTRIRVAFSEPVRHEQGELAADWSVTAPDRTVLAVEGSPGGDCAYGPGEDRSAGPSGCTRTLVLDRPIGEDDRPVVQYVAGGNGIPGREKYSDFASNQVLGFLSARAVDRVLPRVPTVERIAGTAPEGGRVTGKEPAPEVVVGRVTEGHAVSVYLETAGGTGLQPERDRRLAGATADASGARVALPGLDDGVHVLHVVAQDTNGNVSSEATVTYVLDSVRPVLAAAASQGEGAVLVTLTEPVSPQSVPEDWTLTTPSDETIGVTAVEGSGATRTLRTSATVPGRTRLTYRPSGAPLSDAAGNAVAVPSSLVVDGVLAPTVTRPLSTVVTTATEYAVRGTAEPGVAVDLHRDTDGDGLLDPGEPVVASSTAAADGTWERVVELPVGSRTLLLAVARDEATATRSPAVPVPALVQDAEAPELSLSRPTGASAFPGGSEQRVVWTSCDENPGPAPVRVELSLDDGATWSTLSPGASSPCGQTVELPFTTPRVSTDQARVRLVATDLAGRSTTVTSDRFLIDAEPPVFTARTQDVRTVVVLFSEPVNGPLGTSDWTVDGAAAVVLSADRTDATGTRAEGARSLVLRSTSSFGPNDRPEVAYDPRAAGLPAPAGGQLTDRVGQPVPLAARAVAAVDRIVPVAPVIASPEGTTYQADDKQTYAGTAEAGTTLSLLDGTGAVRGTSSRIQGDGSWQAVASLVKDTGNELRAVLTDDAGNTGPATAAPLVVQDSLTPGVRIETPQRGDQLPRDSDVEVRWVATDANLARDAVVVDVTTDGGRTWTVLGEDQPGRGSLTWRTPSEPTSRAAVRVRALDLAGRTGTATEGFLGVGVPADGGTFAPREEPLSPVPAVRGLDRGAAPSPLARVLGSLPRTGTELLYLLFSSLVLALVGAGLLVAARDQRRLRGRRR